MRSILKALLIGISAAIVDVTPMIIQHLDKYACVSAFVQWIMLGLIIPYVNWPLKPWLKGFIVAELAALPILLLVFPEDPMSIVPIIIFSAILGALVGIAGDRLIKGVKKQ